VIWEETSVLKAPAGALFRHKDSWAVFVFENGRARLRAVQVGHGNGL
jgi:HlyD family secretion protein